MKLCTCLRLIWAQMGAKHSPGFEIFWNFRFFHHFFHFFFKKKNVLEFRWEIEFFRNFMFLTFEYVIPNLIRVQNPNLTWRLRFACEFHCNHTFAQFRVACKIYFFQNWQIFEICKFLNFPLSDSLFFSLDLYWK